MSAYIGATRIQDKAGRDLQVWQLTTLERSVCGERLGWALVAARDEHAALRRARRCWPALVVLDVYKGAVA
jgi:hypothetical protein